MADEMKYRNDYAGGLLNQRAAPEEIRRQRELAAEARGEKLDEIHEIITGQVRRMNTEQVAFEQLAHDIRKRLEDRGYKIVPA